MHRLIKQVLLLVEDDPELVLFRFCVGSLYYFLYLHIHYTTDNNEYIANFGVLSTPREHLPQIVHEVLFLLVSFLKLDETHCLHDLFELFPAHLLIILFAADLVKITLELVKGECVLLLIVRLGQLFV